MKQDTISQASEYIRKVIYWDDVEKNGPEDYDESFLASLRTDLKALESGSEKILIVPKRFSKKAPFWGCADLEVMSEEAEKDFFESFTMAMRHLARRIKDCKNIIGFAYPDFENDWEALSHYTLEYKDEFMAAFQKKHSHYIFID